MNVSLTQRTKLLIVVRVRDGTILKNKRIILSVLVWFIFNLSEKNKWLDVHIHYNILA